MTKIVWMSDLHFAARGLVLGHDPRVRLDLAVAHINAHHADANYCVISGDLVNRGIDTDYMALKSSLERLVVPWLPMVGNHDDRELVKNLLPVPENAMAGFIQYTVHTDQVLLLCLDTQLTGRDAGSFCQARQEWLHRVLTDNKNKPALIFMHHPPMALGLPMQDQDQLLDGEAFLDVASAFPETRQLCIGHVHRPVTGNIRGIAFATMRSVLYQAPPPTPAWDWDTFSPGKESPAIGVISIDHGDVRLQYDQFCRYEDGVI